MPIPKFTFKRNAPGSTMNQVIKFQCNMNREENAQGQPILNNRGKEQCFRCMAHKGAQFGDAQPQNTTAADRCTRRTCLSLPFCWQHLQKICRLRIMRSMILHALGINGLGLYAWYPSAGQDPVFHGISKRRGRTIPGQVVTTGLLHWSLYGGEHISQQALDNRYDYVAPPFDSLVVTAPYAHGRMDAACRRGPLPYANDVTNPYRRQRGQRAIPRNGRINRNGDLEALKNIHHGEEISVEYGVQYWSGMDYVLPSGQIIPTSNFSTTVLKVSEGRVNGQRIPSYKSVGILAGQRGPSGPPENARQPYLGAPLYLGHAVTSHMP